MSWLSTLPAWNNNLSGSGVSRPSNLIYLASCFLPLPSGSQLRFPNGVWSSVSPEPSLSTSFRFCFASLKAAHNALQTWQHRPSTHASCDTCRHIVRELFNQLQPQLLSTFDPSRPFRYSSVTDLLPCHSVKADPDSSAHNLCKRLQTLQAPKRQSVPSRLACLVFESGMIQYGRHLFLRFFPSKDLSLIHI